MTNERKKQLLLDFIKMEEDGEVFNFTKAERAEFQTWVKGLISQPESEDKDRNCQSCYYYKNEYCSVLDLKPCYPEKGCDYFIGQNISHSTRIKAKLLDKLSKESLMVVSTAYAYAKNYVNYGCDITKAWSTTVEQAAILERVKTDTYAEAYDSLKKDYKIELKSDMAAILDKIRSEIREWYWEADKQELAKDPCVVDAMIDLFIRTIAKYQALYCNPLKTNEEEEE